MINVISIHQNPYITITLQYDEHNKHFLVIKQEYETMKCLERHIYDDFVQATEIYKQWIGNETDSLSQIPIHDIPKHDVYDYEEFDEMSELADDLDGYLSTVNDIVVQINQAFEKKGIDSLEGNIEDLMHTEITDCHSPYRYITFPDGSAADYQYREVLNYGQLPRNNEQLLKDIQHGLGIDWTVNYRNYYNACREQKIYVRIYKNYFKEQSVLDCLSLIWEKGRIEAKTNGLDAEDDIEEYAWKYLVNTISSVYSKTRDAVYYKKGNVKKSCKESGFKTLTPLIKEILSLRLSNYKIPKYLYDYMNRRQRPKAGETVNEQ
ncbi:hypothetical protein H5983_04695 [Faecalitalea cylindroides]|uniref:hypothetical protein n=1 Tax=Faecalitalea cylindroides TaxID=39483 RepID=UPI0019563495|nr:hypothetical protein [Faecalitalea cylindroides]MBM6810368.1 hypothetical protein [Faecalitalea cylindroides]